MATMVRIYVKAAYLHEESDGKGGADKMIQDINGVLQQKHRIHHTAIQAETRDLCGMDVLCNK